MPVEGFFGAVDLHTEATVHVDKILSLASAPDRLGLLVRRWNC